VAQQKVLYEEWLEKKGGDGAADQPAAPAEARPAPAPRPSTATGKRKARCEPSPALLACPSSLLLLTVACALLSTCRYLPGQGSTATGKRKVAKSQMQ